MTELVKNTLAATEHPDLDPNTPAPWRSVAPHLIGVIDLRSGAAVHAVAGQRSNYQKIDKKGCFGGSPVQLAASYLTGLVSNRGHGSSLLNCQAGLYVADLDAILEAKDDSLASIADIVATQARIASEPGENKNKSLFLDRGMLGATDIDLLKSWSKQIDLHLVIGTESIESLESFLGVYSRLCEAKLSITISIDLKAGQLLCGCPELGNRQPLEAIELFVRHGVRQFIVLDLAAVGIAGGPATLQLCQQVACKFGRIPKFRLISGGGVRDQRDVEQLLEAGCHATLVATWLQNSWI